MNTLNSSTRSLAKLTDLRRLLRDTCKHGLSQEVKLLIDDTVWKIEQLKKKLERNEKKPKPSARPRSHSRSLSVSVGRSMSKSKLSKINKKLNTLIRAQRPNSKSKSRSVSKKRRLVPKVPKLRKASPMKCFTKPSNASGVHGDEEKMTSKYYGASSYRSTSIKGGLNASKKSLKFKDGPEIIYTTQDSKSVKIGDLNEIRSQKSAKKHPPRRPSKGTLSHRSQEKAMKKIQEKELRKEITCLDEKIHGIESKISEQMQLIQKKLKERMKRKQEELNQEPVQD